jgi:gas vesicle protein
MDNNHGLLYFCVGCTAGVVAALLLTPKSGRETVEYLREKADEGTRNVKQSVDNLSHAVTNATARGMKAVRYQAENVGAAVDAGKQAYRAAQESTP